MRIALNRTQPCFSKITSNKKLLTTGKAQFYVLESLKLYFINVILSLFEAGLNKTNFPKCWSASALVFTLPLSLMRSRANKQKLLHLFSKCGYWELHFRVTLLTNVQKPIKPQHVPLFFQKTEWGKNVDSSNKGQLSWFILQSGMRYSFNHSVRNDDTFILQCSIYLYSAFYHTRCYRAVL